MIENPEKLLLDNRSINIETGCWEWTGKLDGDGYGMIADQKRIVGAHRLSYTTFVGAIPQGISVLHKCDNPKCFNPEHLFLGTQTDNMRDMVAKGRMKKLMGDSNPMKRPEVKAKQGNKIRGIKNTSAKLTEEQVLLIYHSKDTQRDLAFKYGISQTQVCDIKHGRYWKHITQKEEKK